MSVEPITLNVDADITITDARHISVQATSADDALRTLRTRHRGNPFIVELGSHGADLIGFSVTARHWSITPDGEMTPTEAAAPDYTLHYKDFRLTDQNGATHQLPAARIRSVAQGFANEARTPVILSSELPGVGSTTYHPTATTDDTSHLTSANGDVRSHPEPDEDPSVPDAQDLPSPQAEEVSITALLEAPEEKTATVEPEPASDSTPSSAHAFATHRTTRAQRLAPAEAGWRGVLNRFFLAKIKPGRSEAEHRQLRSIIQRGLDGHRTAAVLNIKGGVAKSTSTFLIGATLGRHRGGNILAWDNNENSGNLADRGAPANHSNTAVDLYDQIEPLTAVDKVHQLVRYVRPQGDDRFDVLASQNEAADKETIDAEAFRAMHRTLSTFYSQIVVDTGNASNATTWQAAVDVADVLVIAATTKKDGAWRAFATIDALHKQGHTAKLANSVAIITESKTPAKELKQHLIDGLSEHVRHTVVIPWDASLDEGDSITWELLYPETRTAYLRAAAAVVEGM